MDSVSLQLLEQAKDLAKAVNRLPDVSRVLPWFQHTPNKHAACADVQPGASPVFVIR
jgi:hypothetical protein